MIAAISLENWPSRKKAPAGAAHQVGAGARSSSWWASGSYPGSASPTSPRARGEPLGLLQPLPRRAQTGRGSPHWDDRRSDRLPCLRPPSAQRISCGSRSSRRRPFFASVAEHAGLYRSLLGSQGSACVVDHIRGRIAEVIHGHLVEADVGEWPTGVLHDVTAAFTAGALIGVTVDWLQRGWSPAEMAEMTWPLPNALYRVNEVEAR
ncbi:TetR-like C-terminal domain-containing protein [Nonomuraea sp. 10N515B]|uniref:TetR-like C-terminal domain-containing protein n=1 Tax=Nonomuraea sp. 10N515B TaxID=3457422 RepID=UPI003FCD03C3